MKDMRLWAISVPARSWSFRKGDKMVFTKEYELVTGRDLLTKITSKVDEAIKESGIKDGIVVVETRYSTAGILKISRHGEEILDDIVREMRRIVPARINYYHQDSPENAAGHIKSALYGSSVSLILKDGRLYCEDSQDLYFAEYDGPRNRTYAVCVMGEKA